MADSTNPGVDVAIKTIEMHTGGEPVRLIISGVPQPKGKTILEKRNYMKSNLDSYRKLLMSEPRGHSDMYGAILVKPDIEADIGVLFMHNEGYSTMCGHATLALVRYAVDKGYYSPTKQNNNLEKRHADEIHVHIQCPCGLVKAAYDRHTKISSFLSVPAFLYEREVLVNLNKEETVKVAVDIAFGGAYYALVTYRQLNLKADTAKASEIRKYGKTITNYLRQHYKIDHPIKELQADLAFIYGTIICGDRLGDETKNVCVFADGQIDRSPTGSGVTARVAQLMAKEKMELKETLTFTNPLTCSQFLATAYKRTKCGDFNAIIVDVKGFSYYTGICEFTLESDDELGRGFLIN